MEPVVTREWLVRGEASSQSISALIDALQLPHTVAEILVRRELKDPATVSTFLSASLSDLPDPERLPGMSDAAARLAEAVIKREKILVHGDYDVDGISGTSLLVEFLRQCRAEVDFFIPLRLKDGYGLSAEALKKAATDHVDVVVTVDCGISATEEADLAVELGLELLITDHHHPGEQLPRAFAVVNPRLSSNTFPDEDLAGVGVAFFLAVAVRSRLREQGYFENADEPDLRLLLDLVALGTIADVVPLRYVNRLVVQKGLELLTLARRPGIAALLEVSGVSRVSSGSVGFQLAPRLNAAGRLEDASLGVELLLSDQLDQASAIARKLDLFNRERREIEQATLDEAFTMVAELPESQRSIVLSSSQWHPGVIGIVASRLVERFHRPTLLLSCDKGIAKGSARSVPGFHLYQALSRCESSLTAYGGHAAAAGFSLEEANLQQFANDFEEVCQQSEDLTNLLPSFLYDLETELSFLNLEVAQYLERFAPFGIGNPEPLVSLSSVRVQQLQVLNGGHLRFTARQGGESLPCIAFGLADRKECLSGDVDILGSLQVNRWKGRQTAQLVVKDFKPHAGGGL